MKSYKIFIVIVILFTAGCGNRTKNTSTQEVAKVRVLQPLLSELSLPVHASGILVSSEEMKLSFKTGGITGAIPVKEGDKVKKGDLLASLNLSEINAQVSLAGSGYEKALRDYNRTKNLFADSVATLEQMQNVKTALDVAKSNLDIAQFNLNHSRIIAPENGVILKQFVKTNELVAPGYPVFLFGTSNKNWKVKASLSDRDIIMVNTGDSALVKVDAYPGIEFHAIVDQVAEMSNPMTGTYEIEMTINKTSNRLATGFVASVDVFPSKKNSFMMIPVSSIVEADGKTGFVFSVSDSSVVRKVKVEIITISGSDAAIKGDQTMFYKIVSEGAAYLRDGEKVKIVK